MATSIPRGLLKAMGQSGGNRQRDDWKPSETVDSSLRVYRYETISDVNGVPTPEKQLLYSRKVHFKGKGVAPEDCSDDATCERCRKAALLSASGTEDALKAARQLEATDTTTFTVIPIEEPTRFRTFNARKSAYDGIILCMARAGGWKKGAYPKPESWTDGSGDGQLFEVCVASGADKVCGPKGRDIILTPVKKGLGTYWNVRLEEPDLSQPLAFPEDKDVLSPKDVNDRIKNAMAKKAQNGGNNG